MEQENQKYFYNLCFLQVLCVLMVAHNFFELLVGIKALPVGAKVGVSEIQGHVIHVVDILITDNDCY